MQQTREHCRSTVVLVLDRGSYSTDDWELVIMTRASRRCKTRSARSAYKTQDQDQHGFYWHETGVVIKPKSEITSLYTMLPNHVISINIDVKNRDLLNLKRKTQMKKITIRLLPFEHIHMSKLYATKTGRNIDRHRGRTCPTAYLISPFSTCNLCIFGIRDTSHICSENGAMLLDANGPFCYMSPWFSWQNGRCDVNLLLMGIDIATQRRLTSIVTAAKYIILYILYSSVVEFSDCGLHLL